MQVINSVLYFLIYIAPFSITISAIVPKRKRKNGDICREKGRAFHREGKMVEKDLV